MAELEAFDEFIVSVVRAAWDVFRREALMFVLAAVVLMVVSTVSFGLLAGPLTVGFIDMVRRSRRGEPIAVGMLFSRFDTLVPSLVAGVVIVIAVTLGLLLLVVPGLIAAVFSTFTMHVIAYEGSSGIDAIRRSVELVRTYLVHTLALIVVISIAHTLGSMVLFGVIVTLPLSLIALTLGYEQLSGATLRHELTVEP